MASPCLNNSDSSRRKSLAKVLEDGADFWRLWIALGGLVICKYLIISYLTEFDIKCMAFNLPGHSCRLEWNGIKSLTKQLASLAYSWEIKKEHRFYHRNQFKRPFCGKFIVFFKVGEFLDGYHFEFTFFSSHGDGWKIIDVKYNFDLIWKKVKKKRNMRRTETSGCKVKWANWTVIIGKP